MVYIIDTIYMTCIHAVYIFLNISEHKCTYMYISYKYYKTICICYKYMYFICMYT